MLWATLLRRCPSAVARHGRLRGPAAAAAAAGARCARALRCRTAPGSPAARDRPAGGQRHDPSRPERRCPDQRRVAAGGPEGDRVRPGTQRDPARGDGSGDHGAASAGRRRPAATRGSPSRRAAHIVAAGPGGGCGCDGQRDLQATHASADCGSGAISRARDRTVSSTSSARCRAWSGTGGRRARVRRAPRARSRPLASCPLSRTTDGVRPRPNART